MTYSINIWTHPKTGDERLYLNGTARKGIYIKWTGEKCVWSSRTNDTPAKFRRGDHYGKVRKDSAAVSEVLEAFGHESTQDVDHNGFDRLRQIARDGIMID